MDANIYLKDSSGDPIGTAANPLVVYPATGTFDIVSPLTTKGDLLTYTTTNTRLAVATNNYLLKCDSTQAEGVKWGQVAHSELTSIDGSTYHLNSTGYASVNTWNVAPANKGVTNGDTHDHIGGDGASIAEGAFAFTDVTTANVSTTKHGFAPKAVAPSSGILNVYGIASGETAITNKAIFDFATPQELGTATSGTSVVAARVDHVHNLPGWIFYNQIVGVEWDRSSTSPVLTRIDENGEEMMITRGMFDYHVIWGNIQRCNLSDGGTVNAYYGDSDFASDGSNGQVMVEIPKFYYKSATEGTTYRWWISPVARTGFATHPAFISDGVTYDHIYVGAFHGSAYDVTAAATEVNTIRITAEPTADGNITITLDGNYAFTVAVLNADTIEGVVDKIVAAGNKTDYQGVVWTVAKVDADELTYTADSVGLKSTATFSGGTTGVTATVTKTTSGAGGYVKNDAAGLDFTATTGDVMVSIAGVKPLSGWKNATATLPNMRILAQNRGAGWNLINFNQVCAIQLLYLIEYAHFNSQTQIGLGVTGVNDATAGTTFNNALNNGFTAGVGTSSTDLGNASGACTGVTHYKTAEADADIQPVSYRGIENFWGNIWSWIDGINIKANYNPWIADHDFASDTFTHPYVDTGLTVVSSDGYVSNIIFGAGLDYGFLASSVSGGGSEYYLCDYFYRATGNRSARLGGSWYNGLDAGAFYWNLSYAASDVYRYLGSRLAFVG
jgi:hypothetical protein